MIAKVTYIPDSLCRAPALHKGVDPWLKLALGFGLILLFMFGFGSLAQSVPGARKMAQVIEERDLRATAIYYTDFEEPAEGSERIRDSLAFPPRSIP